MRYITKSITPVAAMLFALTSPQAQAVPGDSSGTEFDVNIFTTGDQSESSTAMDAEGNFIITWHSDTQDNGGFGIYAQRFNADGNPAGMEFRVNTTSFVSQENPSIAMAADGDFVIAWDSQQDGNLNVYAQRFNADGSEAGGEFRVNTETLGPQSHPVIAMDAGGDFVIVWNSLGQDGENFGLYAQRYNAGGNAAGAEFRVNTDTEGPQQAPGIAMDAGGNFVITWESSLLAANLEGSDFDIYAQRFNADGSTEGGEFLVNTAIDGTQSESSVALDAAGNFVITWHSDVLDNGNFDIYARRYNANGSDAGTGVEDIVNTVTTGDQAFPSIAMDADGDFVITWHSDALNNGDFDIYARRYNADGSDVGVGVEDIVNTVTTTSKQLAPSIAMAADDDFIIAWHSDGQDGSDNVYAQRYLGAAKKTIDLNLVVQDDTDPVTEGNNFVYTMITTNNGNGIALGVNLSVPLATDLSYVSHDAAMEGWSCVPTAATLTCHKPFMSPAEMSTVNVTVKAIAAGTLSKTVTASAGQTDADTADNSDTETTVVDAAPSSGGGGGGGSVSLGAILLLLISPLWLRRRYLR